jgi:hypothetical protein
MAVIRTANFDHGSLTGTDGFDTVTNPQTQIVLNTTSPINGAGDVGVVNPVTTGNNFGIFLASVGSRPTLSGRVAVFQGGAPAGDQRIVSILASGTALLQVILTAAGTVILRNGSGTVITGNMALTVGQKYWLGWRYTVGTGANGVLEMYASAYNAEFGAPIATTNTDTHTGNATEVRVGMTTATLMHQNTRFDQVVIATDVTPPLRPNQLQASRLGLKIGLSLS